MLPLATLTTDWLNAIAAIVVALFTILAYSKTVGRLSHPTQTSTTLPPTSATVNNQIANYSPTRRQLLWDLWNNGAPLACIFWMLGGLANVEINSRGVIAVAVLVHLAFHYLKALLHLCFQFADLQQHERMLATQREHTNALPAPLADSKATLQQ